jgi:hypothetical protein
VQTPTKEVPAGFNFAGQTFNLNAYQEGALLDDFTFSISVTITLNYIESEINGLEEDLLLMYWDEDIGIWLDAACGPYDRHLDEDRLRVPICHLSEFALFVDIPERIYLPLVMK